MNIWVDLANSPQVLFFEPILKELQLAGHTVQVTTRAYAQTVALADRLGIVHQAVGKHGGEGFLGLAAELGRRAGQLAGWARRQRFDLAVSHNSYAQLLAARLLGIRAVTTMDYEHQPLNHLAFRLADKVLVPEPFPQESLVKFGAARKAQRYPGIKEQVHLSDFQPNPRLRQEEGLPEDTILAVIRPPATWAAYHRFENDLFDRLVERLAEQPGVHILFLPRLASQADSLRRLDHPNLQVAEKTYHGPQLLWAADLAVSGGGTMNREAAVLGTPAYSVFKGRPCAVDDYLVQAGRLRRITGLADLQGLHARRVDGRREPLQNPDLKKLIAQAITD
jgi:hypothetical protein